MLIQCVNNKRSMKYRNIRNIKRNKIQQNHKKDK